MTILPEGAEPVERIELSANPSIPCIALHLAGYCWAASFIPKNSSILDIACGTGYGTNLLANLPAKVLGVDLNPGAISHAQKNHSVLENKQGQVNFLCSSCEDFFTFSEKEEYDYAVCFETLEHVDDMFLLLRHLLQVSKFGVLLSVPYNEPEGSWVFHKTFKITEKTFQDVLDLNLYQVDFYSQMTQPICKIELFAGATDFLLVHIKKKNNDVI